MPSLGGSEAKAEAVKATMDRRVDLALEIAEEEERDLERLKAAVLSGVRELVFQIAREIAQVESRQKASEKGRIKLKR